MRVIDMLAQAGFSKINFAGGEPTLCPWIVEVAKQSKKHGMVTSIVTNGSKIGDLLDNFGECLDWVALSIDTVSAMKMKRTGRTLSRGPMTEETYLEVIDAIKRHGIRLKINTVVTRETCDDDFTDFVKMAKPERWKILQVLPVEGQNDANIADLQITVEQFHRYVERNRAVQDDGIVVVPENNKMMTGSYIMVDPAGRFFDNTQGTHTYSRPILEVGVEQALGDVSIDAKRFLQRGGLYDW